MSCNSCAKSFSLLRPEKGCPGCGFSFCSKCLNNKTYVKKLNSEAKVCIKCMRSANSNEPVVVEPPKAYYERLQSTKPATENSNTSIDDAIQDRLKKLKEDKAKVQIASEEEIAARLQKIKGDLPSTTDSELQERLAKLKGVPQNVLQSQPLPITSDQRTEQEQASDLMKQYLEEAKINSIYKDEFDALVGDIESRLQKLKKSGTNRTEVKGRSSAKDPSDLEDEDEEETIKKIIEKAKAESRLEIEEISPSTSNELPFCEICNEDANMRCLGCRYLFCKRCFMEHKDDDDDCNRYEPFNPPRG